jgi:GH25 family lysozyme M1 (1,4-beta-N-acetylmuramidase)
MDLSKVTLGIDVWEGSLEVDEVELQRGDVEFVLIRLNSISGNHHLDKGFFKQWAEAANFIRIPYFVYSPWYSGKGNFDWLTSNIPAGISTLAVDIEVRRDGYTPVQYGENLKDFLTRCKAKGYNIILYTGAWFLTVVFEWPSDTEYWWARYPTLLYPETSTAVSWNGLQSLLGKVEFAPGKTPGPCALWQCSGDRIILPGTKRTMDVNVFNGTPLQMITRYKLPTGQVPARLLLPVPEPPEKPEPISGRTALVLVDDLRVRTGPGLSYPVVGQLSKDQRIQVLAEKPISVWIQHSAGWSAQYAEGIEYLHVIEDA